MLTLSAHSQKALQSRAQAYQAFLAGDKDIDLIAITYTANARRDHHEHRLALVASDRHTMLAQLGAFLQEKPYPGLATGYCVPGHRRKVVFVFPGQGGQWQGMGQTLLQQNEVFRATIEECAQVMRQYVEWSLLAEMSTDSHQPEIDVIQPMLFAIQVALATVWQAWGIRPDAVIGHSMGEVAAAYVAQALSLEDAVRIICCRSRLLKRASGQGVMAVVELPLAETRQALAGHGDRLSIAASNSASSTVISGEHEAVTAVVEKLQSQDIFCRLVQVDVASHSPQMEPLLTDLRAVLAGIQPQPPAVPVYSTVTATILRDGAFDADYWVRNLRAPVLFAPMVQKLIEDNHEILLEISPHPTLLRAVEQEFHQQRESGSSLPSLRRQVEEQQALLETLGQLYVLGAAVAWKELYADTIRCTPIPPYPWQHQRYWLETVKDGPPWRLSRAVKGHPLLHQRLPLSPSAGIYVWNTQLRRRDLPYLSDHRVQDAVVLPGAVYLEMVMAAAASHYEAETITLANIIFHKALFLPDDIAPLLQVVIEPNKRGGARFSIYSEEANGESHVWTLHVTGEMTLNNYKPPSSSARIEAILEQCPAHMAKADFYAMMQEKGNMWGPAFQGLQSLWRGEGEALGQVQAPEMLQVESSLYNFHPAILDACGQVLSATNLEGPFVLRAIEQVRDYGRPGQRLWSHGRLRADAPHSPGILEGDIQVFDEAGHEVLALSGIQLQYLDSAATTIPAETPADWLYTLQWQPQARAKEQPAAPTAVGSWLIFADDLGIAGTLAQHLEEQGEKCILIMPGEAYTCIDEQHFYIHPTRREDIRQLLAETLNSEHPPCRGVIHLWSLYNPTYETPTIASLQATQARSCQSVLFLIQALVQEKLSPLPRLWLVTGGAQPVTGSSDLVAVAQAPLWGFGRTLAQEHAALWGGLVDIDPDSSVPETASQLFLEIQSPDGEDQIAFRRQRRYVARLLPRPQAAQTDSLPLLRSDGSYLITGGLGELGLIIARWLVTQGATRLILMGRTPLPPRRQWHRLLEEDSRLANQITTIRELEAMGASIHLAAVDVTEETQLTRFLESFRQEGWPSIRGVIHAAGVVELQTILELTAAGLNEVIAPKMTGGWLLHQLLEGTPLDFFVLFSSFTALLGSPRLAHYAAANAFLDALAHYRRAQGLPALSLNWALWGQVGMASRYLRAGHVLLQGAESFTPQQGLELLAQLLPQDIGQIGIMRVNWERWVHLYPDFAGASLLTDLTNLREGNLSADNTSKESLLNRDKLLAVKAEERQPLVETYLCTEVGKVLGLPPEDVNIHHSFNNLGVDSLMGVRLKNQLEARFGIAVPLVKFLEGMTIVQLTAIVLEQLTETTPITSEKHSVNDQKKAQELLDKLDQLSDSEVDMLLREMLTEE